MFIKIEFSDDDLSSDDTGGNSEELDVPCFDQFNETHYSTMRNNCAELDHNSLDIVIISQIMANTNISEFLEIRGRKHQRQNYRTTFYHLSRKVSRK